MVMWCMQQTRRSPTRVDNNVPDCSATTALLVSPGLIYKAAADLSVSLQDIVVTKNLA